MNAIKQKLSDWFYVHRGPSTAIILFAVLLAVGFSFQSGKILWFWYDMPLVGTFLIALVILLSHFWLQAERRRHFEQFTEEKENALLTRYERLSSRELEIIGKLRTGKSNQEIAGELFVELSTVKSHLNRIYKKLEVRNRREAISLLKKIGNKPGT
ncbi:MAG: helix-turn-helix transcriptional regulator [Phaeodactylibacter sp.]|nr:helix-turn-helix transcriptional regulator [Phaeodactylibacter sp.]MCB9300817.1 helix-turn-helix transcriptional regulator [Lewinellaceae bacterium]